MYTILVNDDNTTTASIKERIMERSNLMNSLRILVKPEYVITDESGYDIITSDSENITDNVETLDIAESTDESEVESTTTTPIVVDGIANMSRFTLLLEYVSPISKKYRSEILTLTTNDDGTPKTYKGRLEYKLPVTTHISKEAGEVEMKMTFTAVDLDINGKGLQYVRKVDSIKIQVIPVSAWVDIIPDEAFNPIDQRLIKAESQIKALEDLNDVSAITKADNIKLDEESNTIYLTAEGEKIGDAIDIDKLGITLAENTKSGLIKMII